MTKQSTGWGGKRAGAGRPRKDGLRGPGVPHLVRSVTRRSPLHVTWKIKDDVVSLRSRRSLDALSQAMSNGSNKFGFRLLHYAVIGNHIHLIVEANDRRSLGRGMKGLGVRISKGLNRVMERHGRVLHDRYDAQILRTQTEVKRMQQYFLKNGHRED